jgi:scyllo-inositol 2-dehydrogenase (NADP+)
MLCHPSISVLFMIESADAGLESLLAYLRSMPHIRLSVQPQLPQDLDSYDVVVSLNDGQSKAAVDSLTKFVQTGRGWLTLVHLSTHALPSIFGVQQEPLGPPAELRVLFESSDHPMAVRLPDAVYLKGRFQALTRTADDSETILYADWQYRHKAVFTYRCSGRGRVACTTLQDYANPNFQRVFYRFLCQLAGRRVNEGPLGVGILGYAPSVGPIHGHGIEKTAGLKLRAVCDSNPHRLNAAGKDFPAIKTYASAEKIVADPDVDLVIVATPPNSHARLCLQMMAGGKHVVCEKPLALNHRETDTLMEMAAEKKVHLSCHQNRRWDPDYLAIKQTLSEGLIGDLFYVETFVGGFFHPCGYWHSDVQVSGGTSYDWGAHYLDWIVGLIPHPVEAVIGIRHKRVWHDVTNADQERIQIRFCGGKEAEFMHSDVAAVRKPKWYLLGDEGAIVGHWRDVTSHEIDPILYFRQHDIPATEMMPDLTVCRRHDNGSIVSIKPAVPAREHYRFHGNLADHLLFGEPIAAPLEDSVKVVAILEAAARSMANGGTLEEVRGGTN